MKNNKKSISDTTKKQDTQVKYIDAHTNKHKSHVVNNTNKTKNWKQGEYIGFMCPKGPALDYLMAELLLSYAEQGCTVNCGPNWTNKHIQAAIKRGPHISAKDPNAAAYAWAEA